MFGLFRKKDHQPKNERPPMVDLYQNPLKQGDLVQSFRYDLGKCLIIVGDDGELEYESVATGKRVSWVRMIDASTNFQKVKKIYD